MGSILHISIQFHTAKWCNGHVQPRR